FAPIHAASTPVFHAPSFAAPAPAPFAVDQSSGVFFQVKAKDEYLEAIAADLAEHPVLQAVYIKPPSTVPQLNPMAPAPAPPPPSTPDFSPRQGYLDPAPGGIDARFAWQQGARGRGVNVIDLEWGWQFSHEDLLQN